jgi:hypothetical protein
VGRLRKRDVERLLSAYDEHPLASLSEALRIVLDQPRADWSELLAAAPLEEDRRQRLLAQDPEALDDLAAELNELRRFREHGQF